MPISSDVSLALDKLMRHDLDTWGSVWFRALVISTLVVVAGLICEAPEVFHAVGIGRNAGGRIRTFWYFRVRKIDLNGWQHLCPELVTDKSVNLRRIAVWGLIGWSLVALGVAGEGVSEYFVNDAETDLRAFDQGTLNETQRSANSAAASSSLANTFAGKAEDRSKAALTKAGTAERSLAKAEADAGTAQAAAGSALTTATDAASRAQKAEASLGEAEAEAKNAESSASNALTLARGARTEADSFEEELDRIRLPRTLVRQAEFNLSIGQFIGTEYTFSSVFQDEESITFLRILDAALQDAGWRRAEPPGGFPAVNVFGNAENFAVPVGFNTGVAVIAESNESLASLRSTPEIKLPANIRAAVALDKALDRSVSPREAISLFAPVQIVPGNSATVRIAVGKKK